MLVEFLSVRPYLTGLTLLGDNLAALGKTIFHAVKRRATARGFLFFSQKNNPCRDVRWRELSVGWYTPVSLLPPV